MTLPNNEFRLLVQRLTNLRSNASFSFAWLVIKSHYIGLDQYKTCVVEPVPLFFAGKNYNHVTMGADLVDTNAKDSTQEVQ